MEKSKTNRLVIVFVFAGLILGYLVLLLALKRSSCSLTLNEFGDYIGGILNPLFALLSTATIIFLSYTIAKSESKKADESIATQKRVTLSQMRQGALDNLITKLNLFAYEINRIPVHDVKIGSFVQRVMTANLKKDEQEPVIVWSIILYELENFLQLQHLFRALFENPEFKETHNGLVEITSKLSGEMDSVKMVTPTTLEKYIETKQKLVTLIGDFILREF